MKDTITADRPAPRHARRTPPAPEEPDEGSRGRAPPGDEAAASAFLACSRSRGSSAGSLPWCWTQAACLVSLRGPMRLPAGDAAHAMWHLLVRGGWSEPDERVPDTPLSEPRPPQACGVCDRRGLLPCALWAVAGGWRLHRRVRAWRAGSPLGKDQRTVARHAVDRGWVRQRTWALPTDCGACGCQARPRAARTSA